MGRGWNTVIAVLYLLILVVAADQFSGGLSGYFILDSHPAYQSASDVTLNENDLENEIISILTRAQGREDLRDVRDIIEQAIILENRGSHAEAVKLLTTAKRRVSLAASSPASARKAEFAWQFSSLTAILVILGGFYYDYHYHKKTQKLLDEEKMEQEAEQEFEKEEL